MINSNLVKQTNIAKTAGPNISKKKLRLNRKLSVLHLCMTAHLPVLPLKTCISPKEVSHTLNVPPLPF